MIIISEDGRSAYNFDHVELIWRTENKIFIISDKSSENIGQFDTEYEAIDAFNRIITGIKLKTEVLYMSAICDGVRRDAKRKEKP